LPIILFTNTYIVLKKGVKSMDTIITDKIFDFDLEGRYYEADGLSYGA